MDQVFGTSPKVTQEPNVSSLNPTQLALQGLLAGQYSNAIPGLLGSAQSGNPALPYNQPFAAPVTPLEGGLIGDIVGSATGGDAMAPLGAASTALTQILSGQPQDFSQYFKDDIAAPLENTFSTQTLPAIKAAFARSAGGTTSTGPNTGYSGAVGQAATNLGQQLQAADTSLGTTAITNAQNLQLQGVSQAPNLASAFLNNLGTGLSAADLYRQVQQTQLTGQTNWANTGLQFLSSLFGGGNQLSSTPDVQQGNTVVNPGSPGYLGYLLGGIGGMIGHASDPRLKDISEEDNPALAVLRRLKVKDAKYKWEPKGKERPMLMADNVEEVLPSAAMRLKGVGFIKPSELIPLLVRGVQELSEAA